MYLRMHIHMHACAHAMHTYICRCAHTDINMYVCVHVCIDCWYSPNTPEFSLPKVHAKNAALEQFAFASHCESLCITVLFNTQLALDSSLDLCHTTSDNYLMKYMSLIYML